MLAIKAKYAAHKPPGRMTYSWTLITRHTFNLALLQPLDFMIQSCELYFRMVDVPESLKVDILAIERKETDKISQMLSWFAQTCQVTNSATQGYFLGHPVECSANLKKNLLEGERHNRSNIERNLHHLSPEYVAPLLR